MFIVLGAVLFKRELGGAVPWALVLASISIGQIVGGFIALRVHFRHPMRASAPMLFGTSLMIALLALHAPTAAIAGAALISGMGNMVFNSLWETALQQHVPAAALSRVSAYDWFGSLAFQPLGLVLAGVLAGAVGVDQTLWVAVALSAGSIVAMLLPRSVRTLESGGLHEAALEQVA